LGAEWGYGTVRKEPLGHLHAGARDAVDEGRVAPGKGHGGEEGQRGMGWIGVLTRCRCGGAAGVTVESRKGCGRRGQRGLSFISNRQRRKEGKFCPSQLAGIEPNTPAPKWHRRQGMPSFAN
jgi:hypothetical protein